MPVSPEDASIVRATFDAMAAVKGDARYKQITGEIKCPRCGVGKLRYAISYGNGHTRGACDTFQCLSWIT